MEKPIKTRLRSADRVSGAVRKRSTPYPYNIEDAREEYVQSTNKSISTPLKTSRRSKKRITFNISGDQKINDSFSFTNKIPLTPRYPSTRKRKSVSKNLVDDSAEDNSTVDQRRQSVELNETVNDITVLMNESCESSLLFKDVETIESKGSVSFSQDICDKQDTGLQNPNRASLSAKKASSKSEVTTSSSSLSKKGKKKITFKADNNLNTSDNSSNEKRTRCTPQYLSGKKLNTSGILKTSLLATNTKDADDVQKRGSTELRETVNDLALLISEPCEPSSIEGISTDVGVVKSHRYEDKVITKSTEPMPERRLTDELNSTINDVQVLINNSPHVTGDMALIKPKGIYNIAGSSNNKPKKATLGAKKATGITKRTNASLYQKSLKKGVTALLKQAQAVSSSSILNVSKNQTDTEKMQYRTKRSFSMDDSIIVISSDTSLSDVSNTPIKRKASQTPPIATKSGTTRKDKVNLLKKTLRKNWDATPKQPNKGTKMPNFAAIHKKVFEKMEDIATFSKRTEDRAKILLSGKKPLASDRKKQPEDAEKFQKEVQFSKEAKQNTPVKTTFGINKEVVKKGQYTTPKGFTRFGFKITSKEAAAAKRVDDVRTVANKARVPNVKQHTEKYKEIIKGVRSNRRFELLMQMRNK